MSKKKKASHKERLNKMLLKDKKMLAQELSEVKREDVERTMSIFFERLI